jgi:hypothetical protein
MYVAVTVRAGATLALTVPDSAVRRNGENQPLVSVAVAPNQLAQRLVPSARRSVGIRKCFRDSRRANTGGGWQTVSAVRQLLAEVAREPWFCGGTAFLAGA